MAALAVGVVLALVIGELAVRVYLFGPWALWPPTMDGIRPIGVSGMIRASPDLDIQYELLPNLKNVRYKKVHVTTNAAGWRDHEYDLEKPAGVFRTAVDLLQRSWAEMGASDLDRFVDEETRKLHELAADTVDILSFNQALPDRLKVVDGTLTCWPFTFRHPRSSAVVERGEPAGVFVNDIAITTITQVPAAAGTG